MEYKNEDLLKILSAVDEINSFLISSEFSLKSILKIIIDKAIDLSEGTYGQILLYDGYELKIMASTNSNDLGTILSVDECLCGAVVKSKKTLVLGDVSADNRYNRFFTDSKSELAVPLIQGGKILGVLNVECTKADAFNEQTARLVSTLALQASHTIKIAGIYALEKTLSEVKEDLVKSQDNSDLIYQKIISGALKLISGRSGQLLLKEEDNLIIAATTGSEKPMSERVSIENSVSGLAVKNQQAINIGNLKDEKYKELYKSYLGNMLSELTIPIIDGKEVIGVLNFEHSSENYFTDEHIKILIPMANLSAIAIRDFKFSKRLNSSIGEVKTLLSEFENFPEKLSSAIQGIKNITNIFEDKQIRNSAGLLPPTGDW